MLMTTPAIVLLFTFSQGMTRPASAERLQKTLYLASVADSLLTEDDITRVRALTLCANKIPFGSDKAAQDTLRALFDAKDETPVAVGQKTDTVDIGSLALPSNLHLPVMQQCLTKAQLNAHQYTEIVKLIWSARKTHYRMQEHPHDIEATAVETKNWQLLERLHY